MDYYSLNRPQRNGRLSSTGWLTHIGHYPRSGHLSTINQASGKVRQPKTDVLNTEPRRLGHTKQRLLFIYHAVAEQKLPECISLVVGDSEYIMIAQDKVGCLTEDGNVDNVDFHRAPKHN